MKKRLLMAAMGIVSLTPGCVKTDGENASSADPQIKGDVSAAEPDIDKLLKRLAEKPVPAELNFGAMCYKMAMPPDRAEYVCSVLRDKDHSFHKTKSFSWQLGFSCAFHPIL